MDERRKVYICYEAYYEYWEILFVSFDKEFALQKAKEAAVGNPYVVVVEEFAEIEKGVLKSYKEVWSSHA